jgi:Mce-associated membrane protein
VINDARSRTPVDEDAHVSATDERGPSGNAAAGAQQTEQAEPATTGPEDAGAPAPARRKARKNVAEPAADRPGDDTPRRRASLPLVPVLSILLVLLLGAGAFLWFTRDETSAVTTDDYVEVLQAARSNIVDFTSFDHLTLDDDIEQVRRVAVGDLRDGAVEQLDSRRQEITEAEAVVNTEVIGAGVTRADAEEATVLLVIQTTRATNASEQAQIVKYRIEVEMQKTDDRWVLSRITGA